MNFGKLILKIIIEIAAYFEAKMHPLLDFRNLLLSEMISEREGNGKKERGVGGLLQRDRDGKGK